MDGADHQHYSSHYNGTRSLEFSGLAKSAYAFLIESTTYSEDERAAQALYNRGLDAPF